MTTPSRRSLLALAAAAPLLMAAPAVEAQTWPVRPVTMIIPFAAGGPTDVLGRIMAERMSQILGQQVVVENVGGAGGMTGTARISRGSPDGYSFVLGTVGTHAVNQTLYKQPLYNAATDFAPVTLIAEVPLILITRKDFPATNLQEFIAHVKANQAKLQFASAGAGSAVHLGCLYLNSVLGTGQVTHVPYRGSAPAIQDLVGELFKILTQTKIRHVPYRGAGPAMADLVAGQIDMVFDGLGTSAPQIQGGAIRGIAVAATEPARVAVGLREGVVVEGEELVLAGLHRGTSPRPERLECLLLGP